MGYTPNYSHLIGIMISKTIGFRGTPFSDIPTCEARMELVVLVMCFSTGKIMLSEPSKWQCSWEKCEAVDFLSLKESDTTFCPRMATGTGAIAEQLAEASWFLPCVLWHLPCMVWWLLGCLVALLEGWLIGWLIDLIWLGFHSGSAEKGGHLPFSPNGQPGKSCPPCLNCPTLWAFAFGLGDGKRRISSVGPSDRRTLGSDWHLGPDHVTMSAGFGAKSPHTPQKMLGITGIL